MMTAGNFAAYCAQVAILVAVCAGLPRLLRISSPTIQHAFWRLVLAVCLVIPIVQPRQPHVMVFVAAPPATSASTLSAAPAPAPAPPPVGTDWMRVAALVIGVGVVLRLGWIAAGLLRLRRLRRNGVEPVLGFDEVRKAIGATHVPICWSTLTPHPVTFGARWPIVLLPIALKSVDEAAQRAVVAHELHHAKRHDWLWTIAEEVVRAVFWFHPAMWWLISRVQLARETVVDELSILTTNARRAYLDTLLAFADDTGLRSSTAFSARRQLFHRVMLLSKEGTMSSIRIATASCVLAAALAAGTWTAVSAFPLHDDQTGAQALPPPPPIPNTPVAFHLVATVYWEQATHDASLTPDQRQEAVRNGIAAEDHALALDPNYVPALTYKSMLLRVQASLGDPTDRERLIAEADELRQTAIVLGGSAKSQAATTMPPPPPPPPPGAEMSFMPKSFAEHAAELKPVQVGGKVKAPIKIRDVKPEYPPIALQSKVQGVVIIEALIDATGAVADARVMRSIPLLDQAALDAVRQWRFLPVTIDGVARPVFVTLTVNFRLEP
jgi:protein TonB